MSLARLLVGSILLGVYLYFRERPTRATWPTRRDWPPLLACGLLWFGVYNVALNAAERRLDAGTAAMLVHIAPLLIALLAGLTLGEGFPRQLIIGSLIAFGGVVLIGTATSTGPAGRLPSWGGGFVSVPPPPPAPAEPWGVILSLIAAISSPAGVVAQKPLLPRLPAAQVTWLACMIGTVACLPYAPTLASEVTT